MQRACVVLFLLIGLALSVPNNHVADRIRNGLPMRGVNLGGWLVAEHWMTSTSSLWDDIPGDVVQQGEYALMKSCGNFEGTRRFGLHRSDWITEDDIEEIAKSGLNAVRVPVGFWITGFDMQGGDESQDWKVYAAGALEYLDLLVQDWAKKHNIAVLVDLHAARGSQNGYDHSAPKFFNKSTWSNNTQNVENSIDVLEFLVKRYKDEEAFLGVGCLNEPGGTTDENVLKLYYTKAYDRIRAISSKHLFGVAPLITQQQLNASDWQSFLLAPKHTDVIHEWHKYFKFLGWEDKTEDDVLKYVYGELKSDIKNWKGNRLFIGEWSLSTNPSAPFKDASRWNTFASGVVDAYSNAPAGWTYWTWKVSNDEEQVLPWSLRSLIRAGKFPKF
ncbi:glucan 1,3-beta-glucosidase [Acrasis kona]|uniref:glucan 1,3-beta-glucosidase n=1 Tax=Acrasis kona TaxID=1008807 RepID=A0AAW2Z1I2_9EUKA